MISRLFLTLLTQLFIMSSAANDEDPWIESIDESQQHQSQTGEVILDENNVSVRRSTRLASKSSCSPGISDWPLPKILEVLFKSNIPVPSGATHEELFTLLCESIDVPASHSPPHPPTSSKKNTQKRKNFEPVSTSTTGAPKRACGPSSSARSSHSTIQNNDPMLSALSNIQSLISDMNSRIQALESGSASRISRNLLLSGPASSNTASTTVRLPGAALQVDDVIPATVPRRTMGSAVPVSTGSTFFPPTAAISHQLRSQIIAERYTAHSLRIGAATTAASSSPVSTLMAMGRWSSVAYERYLRPDARAILEAQKAMSAAP
ncbi:hypothetical protein G5714_000531 [Onychostoma macrolepis]|uniref:Uncharacterized protein n=1 Tax=Onychostoma macrolepis TaxID=369639 RepID=A0A7J6DGS2_9TELE|nr:hypothetical protein G5714_000531 [Onychostoma macrolepis]